MDWSCDPLVSLVTSCQKLLRNHNVFCAYYRAVTQRNISYSSYYLVSSQPQYRFCLENNSSFCLFSMKATPLSLLVLSCASSAAPASVIKPSQVSSIFSQLVTNSVSGRGNGNKPRVLQNGSPCGLCADGSMYTIEGTLPPSDDGSVTSCAEANAAAQELDAEDPMCDVIHMAGRRCGCPHVTPEGACDVCFDGSPVIPEDIIDTSAIEITGLDVNTKDIGLPDGSGTAISCGELATNLHTMHVVGEIAESEAGNVDVTKDEEYNEALALLCTFFQNFAGPQCGCPVNPEAELCVACLWCPRT